MTHAQFVRNLAIMAAVWVAVAGLIVAARFGEYPEHATSSAGR